MEKNRIIMIAGAITIAVLVLLVIILGAMYGTKECESSSGSGDSPTKATPKGPSMVHFPQIINSKDMVKMNHTSAKAWMKTIAFSQVPGKEMHGGVLKVDEGPALEYTHWYESIMVVLSGSFNMTNGTNNYYTATAGQSMYIPRGAKVSYKSIPATSTMYYVIQPPAVERATDIQASMGTDPYVMVQPKAEVLEPKIPLFPNKFNSSSYLIDLMVSNIKGAEMAGGLYRLLAGPALDYTYTYEEFKYVVSGEFQLTDGTGKKVTAKTGDLMYFPKDTFVHFTSPNTALGFYVGQRLGDTA